MTTMPRIRRPIAAEDGVAMVVAVMVLFIVITLATAAIATTLSTSSTTKRDNNVKAALAVAEAGLQTAIYRLNILHPEEGNKYCVGQSTVEVASVTGGYCKGITEELAGKSSSYTYWTSEALGSSATCVGQAITSEESVTQRCVVAEGTVNGVKRRVSQRVAGFVARPLFKVHGVTGLKKVTLENNSIDNGSAGSNGEILIKNNGSVSEVCELGPSGKVEASKNAECKVVHQRSTAEGPLTLSKVEPGSSAEKCTIVEGKVTSGNSDCLITHYLENEKTPVSPYDTARKVEFNEGTRELKMENSALLVLKEGTYNFCSLEAQNNAVIELAAGAKVVIYIDSAKRSGSKCPAEGSGVLKIWNNAEIINPSHNPSSLIIYVYDNSGGEVYIKNNSELYGTIYAPESKVAIQNNGAVHGAIAANEVELGNNFTFEWSGEDAKFETGTITDFYRSSWLECTPEKTAANPQTGC
jgi:Tfp pilus assembly protein PilX